MYCSTCGTKINTELNYCKRCGARVDKLEKIVGNKSEALQSLSMTTGFVGLGGLALTVGLITILLKSGVRSEVVVMLTFAFLSAVFGICFLMIQQISSMAKPTSENKILDKANPPQIGAVSTAQLEEHRKPARVSVTENTTRTLDETRI